MTPQNFPDLTMRLVSALLSAIDKAYLVDYYHAISAYGVIHGAKLPSLNEFLDLASNDRSKESAFDENTDKFLEMQALKRLEERQKVHG